MRVRVTEQPPTKKQIQDLLKYGAPEEDSSSVVKRLRRSCYLNGQNKPLDAKERLVAQYQNDGLILFLGAGVSCCSGVPNWVDLIKRLLRKAGIEDDYETVNRAFPFIESQFDLVAHRLDCPINFSRMLYQCLYQELKFKSLLSAIPKREAEQRNWSDWGSVVDKLSDNATLKAVGELLIIEDDEGPRRNPQIHAVLTTNADNLLEIYCRARSQGKSRILTMVDRASVGDHPDAAPVYHLHGVLDARGENIDRADSPCDEIPAHELQGIDGDLLPHLVFREAEYYQTVANPLGFANHAPQSYLQRLNVLFVGTSLDDRNVRRWLFNSFCERVEERKKYLREYYCRVYPDVGFEAELESVRHFWLRTRTEGSSPVPTGLLDLSARKLGIQVVWCDDYAEVQNCLSYLKQKGAVSNFGRKQAG